MKKIIISVIGIAAFALAPFVPSRAQETFPTRAVKVVVPLPAASPIDVLARLVAQNLAAQWGKPVIVENKLGATGSIGSDAVAKAPPDGYTLLFTPDFTLTMYAAVAKQLPYNPVTDFKPIATVARISNGVFVNASLPVSTVQELVALAKAQPGKLTFSSSGIASPSHFATEQFKAAAGLDIVHVPYKGAPAALMAAVTGEVSMHFGPIAQAIPHVRTGKVKALAVTSAQASPLLPGVKPLVEQGFPGLIVSSWYPLLAPAKTPDAITDFIRAGLKKAIDDPEIRARLATMGIDTTWESPEQVTRNIATDIKRWSEAAKRANIAPQ